MRIRFLLAVAALVLPLSVKAQSYTYTYTGTAFTASTDNSEPVNPPGTVAAPFTGESITGSFTIDAPITNLSLSDPLTITSFSFSDGAQTLSSSGGDYSWGMISTDGSGDITGYVLEFTSAATGLDWMSLQDLGGIPADQGNFLLSNGHEITAESNIAGSFGAPVSATPEPGSLALLGSGMAGLAFQVRRRLRRS